MFTLKLHNQESTIKRSTQKNDEIVRKHGKQDCQLSYIKITIISLVKIGATI